MEPSTLRVGQFDPSTICPYQEHQRCWRSIHGPHLICADCHPPATPQAVAELIDVGPRPMTPLVALSIARSRRRLNVIDIDTAPAATPHKQKPRRRPPPR